MNLVTFGTRSILCELGLEPAMLFGFDCWDMSDMDNSAFRTCASVYFGPFVLSIHIK